MLYKYFGGVRPVDHGGHRGSGFVHAGRQQFEAVLTRRALIGGNLDFDGIGVSR